MRFLLGLIVGAAVAAAVLFGWNRSPAPGSDAAMAARMHAFVEALSSKPRNADPASQWSPLASGEVRCATCHEDGDAMQAAILRMVHWASPDRPAAARGNLGRRLPGRVSAVSAQCQPA